MSRNVDKLYNMKVVHLGGKLKVVRRPSGNETVSVDMYRPCKVVMDFSSKLTYGETTSIV